jgi:hypothetical protein
MTLALQVAFGTLIFWIGILIVRWLNVKTLTLEAYRSAAFAAAGLSGAYIGGVYPIAWVMVRNLGLWFEQGTTTFTFAGNLPPGVDEDDLLTVIVIGLVILVGQATAEARRAYRLD